MKTTTFSSHFSFFCVHMSAPDAKISKQRAEAFEPLENYLGSCTAPWKSRSVGIITIMLQLEANTLEIWKTDSHFLFCTTFSNAPQNMIKNYAEILQVPVIIVIQMQELCSTQWVASWSHLLPKWRRASLKVTIRLCLVQNEALGPQKPSFPLWHYHSWNNFFYFSFLFYSYFFLVTNLTLLEGFTTRTLP